MIVPAESIAFTESGVRNLSPDDEVQVSSGMGGSYTLKVIELTSKTIKLTRKFSSTPHWYENVEYDLSEAQKELFLLMPNGEFQIQDTHIKIAIKAGYDTPKAIVEAVAEAAKVTQYEVSLFLKSNSAAKDDK